MKRVYVNEQWCLGCHLCEYNCAFANSGETDMVKALKGKQIFPRIHVDGEKKIRCASRAAFPGLCPGKTGRSVLTEQSVWDA